MSKKRKIEETNEITWFQIEIDQLKLEIDYENSTVKKVKLEECFDIYSKMFYWRDHYRVSDGDVQVVKQFFKDKFDLKYLPNIRVRDCKELGYPVVFEILEKYKTTYFLYMTYDGIIHNIRSDHFNPKYKNTGLSCLRYNQNFDDFDFWISQNGEIILDSSCQKLQYDLPARSSKMNDNKVMINILDEGQGFKEKDTNKIFKRFYSNRPDKFGQHSGLGLNIVKNLVDLHNATIRASNRLDRKGASMEIIFPNA